MISEELPLIYAGGEGSQRGVAVVFDKTAANSVTTVVQSSDWMIVVK